MGLPKEQIELEISKAQAIRRENSNPVNLAEQRRKMKSETLNSTAMKTQLIDFEPEGPKMSSK